MSKAWGDVTESMYFWIYSTNFYDYLVPFDSFDGMQDNYKFAVELNAKWLFDQAQWNENGFSTGWHNLKSYLNAKLAWDCDENLSELVDDFFETYFGAAAPEMRQIFDSYRTLSAYNKEYNGFGGIRSCFTEILKEKFWPKNILKQWIEIYDLALAKIEKLKTSDPTAYDLYYKHIAGERLSTYYMFVELYTYNTDPAVLQEYKEQFKADAEAIGLTKASENTLSVIKSLYNKWGV